MQKCLETEIYELLFLLNFGKNLNYCTYVQNFCSEVQVLRARFCWNILLICSYTAVRYSYTFVHISVLPNISVSKQIIQTNLLAGEAIRHAHCHDEMRHLVNNAVISIMLRRSYEMLRWRNFCSYDTAPRQVDA